MTEKTQAALDLFRTKALAYVGTVDEDGQPQVTPVWADLIDGKPAFNTAIGRAKERNLRRDPRVTVAITDPDDPYTYYEIRGTAILTEDGADDFIDALAKKYLDADSYPFRTPGERRINVLIESGKVMRG
jgi:PPOX class probable F420-dependent enzyme